MLKSKFVDALGGFIDLTVAGIMWLVCSLPIVTLGASSTALYYTVVKCVRRDRELLLRWLELACFTPVIRTHEGNRPDSNIQIYSDEDIISRSARLTAIHNALLPYLNVCVRENSESGWQAPGRGCRCCCQPRV